jgi:hypothetical protein
MNPFLALIVPMGEPPASGGGGTGIWGPTDPRPTLPISGWNPGTGQFPPYQPPGGGQPPVPSHPIYGNFPTPPIYYPPGTRPPGQGGPMPQPPISQLPDGTWGPGDPRPTLPISGWNPGTGEFPKPPEGGGGEGERKFEMKTAWSAQTGWIVIFVPAEGTLVPTPSKEGSQPDTASM